MDELFKNNRYRILELFIEFPTKEFSLRGIARQLKLSHATVLKYINDLEIIGLLKKNEETLYPTYIANSLNQKYKFYKKNYMVSKLMDSTIVEHIQKEVLPSSIILFGSVAKGTFNEKSDIDIFVEAKETVLNIRKFERRLGKKVNLLFEQNLNNLSRELRNNIINGIILYGFIKIQ